MSWITRVQQRLSDRVHAGGDAFARQAGWTTTRTAGRFGFGARVYRDPRFDLRRTETSRTRPTPWASTEVSTLTVVYGSDMGAPPAPTPDWLSPTSTSRCLNLDSVGPTERQLDDWNIHNADGGGPRVGRLPEAGQLLGADSEGAP